MGYGFTIIQSCRVLQGLEGILQVRLVVAPGSEVQSEPSICITSRFHAYLMWGHIEQSILDSGGPSVGTRSQFLNPEIRRLDVCSDDRMQATARQTRRSRTFFTSRFNPSLMWLCFALDKGPI